MAKREKISEERKKLIKKFISSNELKTAGDVEEALKNLFKDTLQEMLNAELTEHLDYGKMNIHMITRITEMDIRIKQCIHLKETYN